MSYTSIAENDVGVEIGGCPTPKSLNNNSFIDSPPRAVVYVRGYTEWEVDAASIWWNTTDPLIL